MLRKRKSRTVVDVPTEFPSGLFVTTHDNYYYIKGKTRFKVISERALDSYSPLYVIPVTDDAIQRYPMGPPLGFRNGTLIHNIADGRMYVISDNKRRHIVSPDVFDKYGLDETTMVKVSDAETRLHEEGEPLA